MKKIKSGLIKLKDIKHIENSRIRFKDDVEDLMHDIEHRGLIQSVGVRSSDNALIYGNRRVKAFEKLGYDSIPCDFYNDIDDDDLLITNLSENLKRRDLSTIEIGRVISILLTRNYMKNEVAEKLGLTSDRLNTCLTCYENIKGTPFENIITYHKTKKGIAESLVWKLQSTLGRVYPNNNKIPKEDWIILLKSAEEGRLTNGNIAQLRSIIVTYPKLNLIQCIELLDKGKSVYYNGYFKKDVLFALMKTTKNTSENELIKQIIQNKYPELLF